MKYFTLIILLSFAQNSYGQEIESVPEEIYVDNTYPEGIYRTYRSFQRKTPNSTKVVEARNVFKPKQKITDPFIDNCYFNYKRPDKRVKDVFAISYNGSLYLSVKAMKKMMEGKDKKQQIDFKDSFLRVVDQGRYLYLEGYFSKRGGIGIGIGIGLGPVAAGTGGNRSGAREEMKGLVFDFDREIFELFRDCPDFRDWLDEYNPQSPIDCDSKRLPMEFVREIIFELNAL